MENKFSIKIIYDISEVFPKKDGFSFEEDPVVHFEKGNVFVTHKAFSEDVTVWFKGDGELEIYRASLKEILRDRFSFKSINYNFKWYSGKPIDGYRECIRKLFPEKVSRK